MNTSRITTLLLGPELSWLLMYGVTLLLVSSNQPPTEAGNVRLESLAWYVLFSAIILSFAPLYWSQQGLGWSMLRIGIAGLIGITSVATGFCSAINYHDSRNSGVGTLWMMLVAFGVIFLFLGMIGASLFIKFRTYALPVVKWVGIGLGILLVLALLINLIAKSNSQSKTIAPPNNQSETITQSPPTMVDEVPSPQNTYTVRFGAYEVRMSHWITEPGIYRVADNQLLFDMPSTWSCDEAKWIDDSTVELQTRLYPGREYCNLRLDLSTSTGTAERGRYAFANSAGDPPKHLEGTFDQIYQWL